MNDSSDLTLANEAMLMARPTAEIGRFRTVTTSIGLLAIALFAVGWFTNRATFMQSYLIGFYFWVGITLGSMAVLMVQYLSGGVWGLVGRRVFEASARTWPLMVVLFLPIAASLKTLYVWATPAGAATLDQQVHAIYLNPVLFYVRTAVCFAIWAALIIPLTRWSKQQDHEPPMLPGPLDRRKRVLAGPGLVLYVVTLTFVSTDWVMSLDPHWYSTIWGILALGGQGLSTMAFTLVVLSLLVKFRPMSEVAGREVFHDLSKLMFAFVMLWAYFSISQLIIIWSGNLPEEIPFYLDRYHGPWGPWTFVIVLGEFALPFALLLSRSLKRTPARVGVVAFIILIMRAIDTAWLVAPMIRHQSAGMNWVDMMAVLAFGGVWLFVFWRNLADRALVPARDPYFKKVLAHHGGH